jgi:nicotinamidase-related amidase
MRPAFLFVDLLEDFFAKTPLLERRASIVDAVNDLAGFARAGAHPVIWVRQEYEPDLRDAPLLVKDSGIRVTIKGTPGCRILPEIERKSTDHELVKTRYSAFFGTPLAPLLGSLNCSHIVLGGVNTHACVRATAVDAYQFDYRVIFASDVMASYDEDYHRESMRYLAQSIGIPMTNVEIKGSLRTAGREGSG